MIKKSCKKQKKKKRGGGVISILKGRLTALIKSTFFFFYVCSWVYKLAAPCSELTEATAQIVMEFYILISVIVMIHKTGGEKYRYQCLLNLIAACAVTIVTPLTRSQLVRRIKLTFHSLLNIKWHKIIFCEKKYHVLYLHEQYSVFLQVHFMVPM